MYYVITGYYDIVITGYYCLLRVVTIYYHIARVRSDILLLRYIMLYHIIRTGPWRAGRTARSSAPRRR